MVVRLRRASDFQDILLPQTTFRRDQQIIQASSSRTGSMTFDVTSGPTPSPDTDLFFSEVRYEGVLARGVGFSHAAGFRGVSVRNKVRDSLTGINGVIRGDQLYMYRYARVNSEVVLQRYVLATGEYRGYVRLPYSSTSARFIGVCGDFAFFQSGSTIHNIDINGFNSGEGTRTGLRNFLFNYPDANGAYYLDGRYYILTGVFERTVRDLLGFPVRLYSTVVRVYEGQQLVDTITLETGNRSSGGRRSFVVTYDFFFVDGTIYRRSDRRNVGTHTGSPIAAPPGISTFYSLSGGTLSFYRLTYSGGGRRIPQIPFRTIGTLAGRVVRIYAFRNTKANPGRFINDGYSATISDGQRASFTDRWSIIGQAKLDITDNVELKDTPSKVADHNRAEVESHKITDAFVSSQNPRRSTSDRIRQVENISRSKGYLPRDVRNVLEDTLVRKDATRRTRDTYKIADAAAKNILKDETDPVGIREAVRRGKDAAQFVRDTNDITDAAAPAVTRIVRDDHDITDTTARTDILRRTSDTNQLTDRIATDSDKTRQIADELDLRERTLREQSKVESEELDIVETPVKGLAVERERSDFIIILERTRPNEGKVAGDSVGVSDSILRAKDTTISDAAAISDGALKDRSTNLSDTNVLRDVIDKTEVKDVLDSAYPFDIIDRSIDVPAADTIPVTERTTKALNRGTSETLPVPTDRVTNVQQGHAANTDTIFEADRAFIATPNRRGVEDQIELGDSTLVDTGLRPVDNIKITEVPRGPIEIIYTSREQNMFAMTQDDIDNLFPDISRRQARRGDTDFAIFFVRNLGSEISGLTMEISANTPSPDTRVEISVNPATQFETYGSSAPLPPLGVARVVVRRTIRRRARRYNNDGFVIRIRNRQGSYLATNWNIAGDQMTAAASGLQLRDYANRVYSVRTAVPFSDDTDRRDPRGDLTIRSGIDPGSGFTVGNLGIYGFDFGTDNTFISVLMDEHRPVAGGGGTTFRSIRFYNVDTGRWFAAGGRVEDEGNTRIVGGGLPGGGNLLGFNAPRGLARTGNPAGETVVVAENQRSLAVVTIDGGVYRLPSRGGIIRGWRTYRAGNPIRAEREGVFLVPNFSYGAAYRNGLVITNSRGSTIALRSPRPGSSAFVTATWDFRSVRYEHFSIFNNILYAVYPRLVFSRGRTLINRIEVHAYDLSQSGTNRPPPRIDGLDFTIPLEGGAVTSVSIRPDGRMYVMRANNPRRLESYLLNRSYTDGYRETCTLVDNPIKYKPFEHMQRPRTTLRIRETAIGRFFDRFVRVVENIRLRDRAGAAAAKGTRDDIKLGETTTAFSPKANEDEIKLQDRVLDVKTSGLRDIVSVNDAAAFTYHKDIDELIPVIDNAVPTQEFRINIEEAIRLLDAADASGFRNFITLVEDVVRVGDSVLKDELVREDDRVRVTDALRGIREFIRDNSEEVKFRDTIALIRELTEGAMSSVEIAEAVETGRNRFRAAAELVEVRDITGLGVTRAAASQNRFVDKIVLLIDRARSATTEIRFVETFRARLRRISKRVDLSSHRMAFHLLRMRGAEDGQHYT